MDTFDIRDWRSKHEQYAEAKQLINDIVELCVMINFKDKNLVKLNICDNEIHIIVYYNNKKLIIDIDLNNINIEKLSYFRWYLECINKEINSENN